MRIAVIALLVLVATGCGSGDPEGAPPEQTTTAVSEQTTDSSRDAAPALSGESLEGESLALGDFRGRAVLINVWSSW